MLWEAKQTRMPKHKAKKACSKNWNIPRLYSKILVMSELCHAFAGLPCPPIATGSLRKHLHPQLRSFEGCQFDNAKAIIRTRKHSMSCALPGPPWSAHLPRKLHLCKVRMCRMVTMVEAETDN